MHDIDTIVSGLTFKNSSASNFETYKDNIDFTIKNRNKFDIDLSIIDFKTQTKITDIKSIKKEECLVKSLSLELFKNKTIQIYSSSNMNNYIIISIPIKGHVKIFLNIVS